MFTFCYEIVICQTRYLFIHHANWTNHYVRKQIGTGVLIGVNTFLYPFIYIYSKKKNIANLLQDVNEKRKILRFD